MKHPTHWGWLAAWNTTYVLVLVVAIPQIWGTDLSRGLALLLTIILVKDMSGHLVEISSRRLRYWKEMNDYLRS